MKKNKSDPLNTSIKHINAKINEFFINNIFFLQNHIAHTLFLSNFWAHTSHFKPTFDFHLHGLCLENHGTMVLYATNQLFCKLTTNTLCMAATPTPISIDLCIQQLSLIVICFNSLQLELDLIWCSSPKERIRNLLLDFLNPSFATSNL